MKTQTTQDRIMSVLNRRKTGITSKQLAERLETNPKTIRNCLGILMQNGDVTYDEYMVVQDDRYVTGYVAA